MNRVFRVYTSTDVRGIELGGAVKNVIALAAGIADGLGYGDNTKAALITRGIAETARLGVKIGANWETFAGLTGIGDLIVTCASMHSRNRRAGILIGQGKSMEEAMREVGQARTRGAGAGRNADCRSREPRAVFGPPGGGSRADAHGARSGCGVESFIKERTVFHQRNQKR